MENPASSTLASSGTPPAGGSSSGTVATPQKTMEVLSGSLETSEDGGEQSAPASSEDKGLIGFDSFKNLLESDGEETTKGGDSEDKTAKQDKVDGAAEDTSEAPKDETPPVEDTPVEIPEKPETGVKPPARVLDGLDPAEQQAFRKMSNDAYNQLYPKFLQFKRDISEKDQKINELTAKALDSNKAFYAHEEGYRLSPDFTSGVAKVQGLGLEADHWRSQLAAIEDGATEWEDLGRDADGNYFVTARHPVNAQNKVLLQERLNNTNRVKDSAMEQLRGLQKSHKDKYSKAVEQVQKKQVEVFPESKNSEHQGWKVANEIIKTFLPEEFQTDPLAKTLGFMGFKLMELQRMLEAYQKKEKTTSVLEKDKPKQTTVKGTLGTPSGVKKEMSWEDMQKHLAED